MIRYKRKNMNARSYIVSYSKSFRIICEKRKSFKSLFQIPKSQFCTLARERVSAN